MRRAAQTMILSALLAACGGNNGSGNGNDNDKPAPDMAGDTAVDTGRDAGPDMKADTAVSDGATDDMPILAELGFVPANIDPDGLPAPVSDLLLDDGCSIDTDDLTVDCADASTVRAVSVDQADPDRTPAAVFVAANITVETSANVNVVGTKPLILVAYGEARILGVLRATPGPFSPKTARGGGFSSPDGPRQNGLGPGGGGPGSDGVGASGGSHCGLGGGGAPGAAYGEPTVRPLRGGSSGGSGFVGRAGAGGGAIQIVARDGIDIASGGALNAGASGGNFGGGPSSQPASAGGAGGAVLLQAPTVRVAGAVAANGGGGGGASVAADSGSSATPNASPAAGGTPNGGDGSAGTDTSGGDGEGGGAAGGGAGWIRIDTADGTADVGGVLSPDASTDCASFGVLE